MTAFESQLDCHGCRAVDECQSSASHYICCVGGVFPAAAVLGCGEGRVQALGAGCSVYVTAGWL